MADTIERIYRLTVDGAQAARDLNAIAKSAENADKRFEGALNMVKKFAGVMAAGFTVGAIVSSIKRNIDAMDELSKSVQKVGIAAEDLQKLRYAADLSGLSAEDLDKSIGKLAVSMTDLATGTTDAHKALRAIGVQSGDSPVQALDKIADEFAKMPDGIDKTAMAITIFGKAGAALIPLLNGGSKGLKELADEAERYGVVLSGTTLKSAEAFNDNLTRLEGVAGGVMKQLTAGLLPALQAISQSFVDSASTGDGFVETGDAIGMVLVKVAGIALQAGAVLKAFGLIIGAVAAAAANPLGAREVFEAALRGHRPARQGDGREDREDGGEPPEVPGRSRVRRAGGHRERGHGLGRAQGPGRARSRREETPRRRRSRGRSQGGGGSQGEDRRRGTGARRAHARRRRVRARGHLQGPGQGSR